MVGSIRIQLMGLALLAMVAGRAAAQQPPSLLDEQRKLNAVAAQKLETEISEGLRRAVVAAPAEAAQILKDLLAKVEADTALGGERRTSLTKMLKGRVDAALAASNGSAKAAADDEKAKARLLAQRQELERKAADREKIRTGIDAVVALQRDGRNQEAEKRAAEIARQFPENPAAMAMGRTSYINARIREARQILTEQDRRSAAALIDLNRTSTPPAGDVEFPKDWNEKTAKRTTVVKLTEKEQAILKGLGTQMKPDFKGTRFEEAIEFISTLTGQPIILDKQSLDEAQVTYDTPVTFQLGKPISVRSVLRKILNDHRLTFVVREEQLHVVSVDKARTMMSTRTYYLGDIVTGTGAFGNPLQFGPFIAQKQMEENVRLIVEMIKDSIDPQSWEGRGGAGTITFHQPTMSIIVRQSAEVHAALSSGLKR
jgi:hypothetical protein